MFCLLASVLERKPVTCNTVRKGWRQVQELRQQRLGGTHHFVQQVGTLDLISSWNGHALMPTEASRKGLCNFMPECSTESPQPRGQKLAKDAERPPIVSLQPQAPARMAKMYTSCVKTRISAVPPFSEALIALLRPKRSSSLPRR